MRARTKPRAWRPLLVTLVALLASGCLRSGGPHPHSPTAEAEREVLDREYAELVESYTRRTGATQISYDELREKLDRGEEVFFLDVRERQEHVVGAVPGATLLPPAQVGSAALNVPAGATVVAYCTAGYRSGLAAVELQKRLGRPVLNLSGGIIEWFNRGGRVENPDGKPVNRIHPFGEDWAKYVHPRGR